MIGADVAALAVMSVCVATTPTATAAKKCFVKGITAYLSCSVTTVDFVCTPLAYKIDGVSQTIDYLYCTGTAVF